MKTKKTLVLFVVLTILMSVNVKAESIENPNLVKWAESYLACHLTLLMQDEPVMLDDSMTFSGKINYDESMIRWGNGSGKEVVDGGVGSAKGTFAIGAGAGLDDDNLWYVSFTYEKNVDSDVMLYNTYFMLLSSEDLLDGLSDAGLDDSETEKIMIQITQQLLMPEEDIAIQTGNMVAVSKKTDAGQRLIALETVDFYEEFYKGSIENYITIS